MILDVTKSRMLGSCIHTATKFNPPFFIFRQQIKSSILFTFVQPLIDFSSNRFAFENELQPRPR